MTERKRTIERETKTETDEEQRRARSTTTHLLVKPTQQLFDERSDRIERGGGRGGIGGRGGGGLCAKGEEKARKQMEVSLRGEMSE